MNSLLLLLIATFGQIHSSSSTTDGESGDGLQAFNDPSPESRLPSRPRVRRDADANVDTSVSRMRKIARITNGIYLTQGFIDGSISSDAFISELLHLGTVTPTAIKSMGLEQIQTAFQEISDTKLEKTADATRIEDRLKVFEEIRKATPDIGDTTSLEGADEYKTELTALNDPGLLGDFEKLSSNIKTFVDNVEALKKAPDDLSDLSVQGRVWINIGKLENAVKELKTASGSVKDAVKFEHSLKSDLIFAPISKMLNVFSIIENHVNLLAKFSVDDRGLKVNKANIEKLANLGLLFEDHQSEMKRVMSIFETRRKQGIALTALTAGFPGGSGDLYTIPKDLGDPWIEQLTDDKDSFEKAMGSLSSLGAIAGSIDGFFGHSPDKQLNALGVVTEIGDNVSPFAGNSQEVWTSIEKAHGCGFEKLNVPDDLNPTKTVVSAIEELRTKIGELKNLQGLATYLTQNDQLLTKIDSIFPPQGSPEPQIETILENLTKSTELEQVFKKLKETKLTKIDYTASPTISEQISQILADFPKLAQFQTESTKHVAAVKCLHGVKNFDHVPKAINAIQSVRDNTKPETIQKGIGAVKKVIDASEGLERLYMAINKLKGGRIPETDALQLLPDQAKHSLTIGSATREIIKLKSAIKHQKELDKVLNHLNLVKSELASVKNLDPKLQKNLEILVALEPKIQKMKSDVSSWKSGIVVSNSPKLKSQASVFTEAQQVTGIDEDLKELGDSVEQLKTHFKNDKTKVKNLEELRKALLKLDSAGLKLSDHSKYLSDAANSLAVLDVFFVDYVKKLNPPATQPPIARPDPPQSNPNLPAQQEEKTTDSTNPWLYFVGGVGSTLLVVAIIIVIFKYCWQPDWFKLKKQTELEKENEKLLRPRRQQSHATVYSVRDTLNTQEVTKNDPPLFQVSTKKTSKKSEKKSSKVEKSEEAMEPPSLKKAREPKKKDKEEGERKTTFEKYLDKKVKTQKKRIPIAFLPTKNHPEIEQVQQPICMLFLYNMMMEIQKAKGFNSAILLPTIFFDYFRHWFTNGILSQLDETVNVGDYGMFEDDGEWDNYQKLDKDDRERLWKYSRHDIPINLKTMPSYKNMRVNGNDCGHSVLHANFVRLPNMKRVIITQAPIMKKDDPAPFMNFVRDVKASNIVMFGSFFEDGIYMPLEKDQVITFDESEYGEPETVKCFRLGSFGDEVKSRSLIITIPPNKFTMEFYQDQLRKEEKSAIRRQKKAEQDFKRFDKRDRPSNAIKPTNEYHICRHYQYEAITGDSVPIDPYPLTRIATELYDTDRVIVHCSDGLGVSAAFTGAIYGFQQLGEDLKGEEKQLPQRFLSKLMMNIRSHRFGAYKQPIHLALTSMILVEMTFAGEEMMTKENVKIYRELMTCYAKAIEIQNEMNMLETEFRRTPDLSKPAAPEPAKKKTKSTGRKKTEEPSKKTKGESKPEEKSMKKSSKDVRKSSKKQLREGDAPVALSLEKTQEDSLVGEPINKSKKGFSMMRMIGLGGS